MRDKNIKHGLSNSLKVLAKDTYSISITDENLKLVYDLILNKPHHPLEIATKTRLTLEVVSFCLMELRVMSLVVDCGLYTHRNGTLKSHYYKALPRKEDVKNKYRIQKRNVFRSFAERPKTMLEVATETGIYRANICRYVADFREADIIEMTHQGICPISKYKANFYLTRYNV